MWYDSQMGQNIFLLAQTGSVAETAPYLLDIGGDGRTKRITHLYRMMKLRIRRTYVDYFV
jgi:hypothetical protein